MARKKTSSFGVADGFFTQEVQEVQEFPLRNAQEVQKVQEHRELGSTQGKKGEKLKRINMAFSDKNHDYIKTESRRRGMTATAFVNHIISEYAAGRNGHIHI